MPQFNDIELTAAVLQSFEEVKNPRVKFLMEELTRSLHEFVRKTDLTFGEWEYAIDFLTRVGQSARARPRPPCSGRSMSANTKRCRMAPTSPPVLRGKRCSC